MTDVPFFGKKLCGRYLFCFAFSHCENFYTMKSKSAKPQKTWLTYRELDYETLWQILVAIWRCRTNALLSAAAPFRRASSTSFVMISMSFVIRNLKWQNLTYWEVTPRLLYSKMIFVRAVPGRNLEPKSNFFPKSWLWYFLFWRFLWKPTSAG